MHMIADQLITPNMLADIDRALKKATRCEHASVNVKPM